jgi:hypothetical protein
MLCAPCILRSPLTILEGPAIRGKSGRGNIRAGRRRNHFPFHVWLAQNWIGQRDYLAADVCKKIAHSPRKLLIEKNCSQNLLSMSKFIVSKNLLNKFAHRESNLLTENQFCSRRIMNCPSVYMKSKYGRTTRFLSTHKLLKAKKICSQQKFAHRICSQHRKTAHDERPCRLGWINTMAKCFVSSQSEHGWRAPLNGLSRNGWNVLGRTFLHAARMHTESVR